MTPELMRQLQALARFANEQDTLLAMDRGGMLFTRQHVAGGKVYSAVKRFSWDALCHADFGPIACVLDGLGAEIRQKQAADEGGTADAT